MISNIGKRYECKFVVRYITCLFFLSIFFSSTSIHAERLLQFNTTNRFLGEFVNSVMNIFASEAKAEDVVTFDDFKVANDFIPSGDIVNSGNGGTLSYSYPIEVPTGRGGLTPKLSLSYSNAGQNGLMGVGWDFTASYIERQTKFGKPGYTDDDGFELKFMGSNFELFDSGTEYRVKNENIFLKIIKSSDAWTVTDKNGNIYSFGSTTATKLNAGSVTFRWYLNSITDLNGNVITYNYNLSTTENQIYPSSIDYNVDYHIVFVYESRTDTESNYRFFFNMKTLSRLKEIQVYYGSVSSTSNIIRKYLLSYDYSESIRSILKSITQYGAGGTTALPPTTFDMYNTADYSFESPVMLNPLGINDYSSINTGDFNGDGKADIIYWYGNRLAILLSNGSGFTGPYWTDSSIVIGEYFQLGDFNGDGKTDIARHQHDGDPYTVMLSNGDGTFSSSSWHAGYVNYSFGKTGDVNGDGKSDIITFAYRSGWEFKPVVMLNEGDHFDDPQAWSDWTGIFDDDNKTVKNFADFNGDGKTDIIVFKTNTSGATIYIQYSTGAGFTAPVASTQTHTIASNGWRLGDFNGDGKMDLLFADQGKYYVMISNGTTLNSPVAWCDFNVSTDFDNYQTADMNGDGKTDLFVFRMVSSNDIRCKVLLSTGDSFKDTPEWGQLGEYPILKASFLNDFDGDGQADLLYVKTHDLNMYLAKSNANFDFVKKITDSLGATTETNYSSITNGLPFKVQAVSDITKKDNQGHTKTQTYAYGDGEYDFLDREFRGFSDVTITDSATGLSTQSHYFQDDVFKGRLSWAQTNDIYAKTVSHTDNTWQAVKLVNDAISGGAFTHDDPNISDYANFRTFAYISNNVVKNFKPTDSTNPYSTITTNYSELDNFGNFALVHRYTNDTTPIHQYTRTVYNNNTSSWTLGQPSNIRISNISDPGTTGHALRETKFLYYTSNPNKPWLLQYKKQLNWVTADGTLTSPLEYTSAYEYDNYGNLIKEKDPKAFSSSPTYYSSIITYDANSMFPIVTTNALGQTVTRTFDAKFGKVLTEKDDANNVTTTYYYDEFGRPGGSPSYTHDIVYPDGSYKDFTYHVAAGNHYTIVQSSSQPTVTIYYDNFGRDFLEKTAATDGTTIWVQTLYDNAGRVSQKSLPSYNSTFKWNLYHYDLARGFLDKQTNSDNTYKTFTKNGLTETTTDENGHVKTTIEDSLGRVKKVTDAKGGAANYTYDIFDNLRTVIDPLGSVTTIIYDDLGRKVSMDDPYMGFWEYGYDANGNLISQTDGKGDETVMVYDRLNRIDLKTYSTDNKKVDYVYGENRTGYIYNKRSLTTLTTISTSVPINPLDNSTIVYNYDNMGRIVNEAKTILGTTYQTDSHYDSAGRIDYIKYPDTARTRYNYTYDPIGTLNEVRQNGATSPIADFVDYNALGQVGSVSYKNGSGTEYFYYETEGNYRLKDLISTDKNGIAIQNLHYVFDAAGNIGTITDIKNTVTHAFTYDEVNRLKTAIATSTDTSRVYNQGFNYDLSGNIISKTGPGGYTVQTWEDPTKHVRPAAINFNSSKEGIGNRTIVNNQDNKPIEISYNSGATTKLYYDGEGNRISKVQGTSSVTYVGEIYEVRDGQAISYIYANGQKIVTLSGSDEYYTHPDHLGSTALTTDKNGLKIEEIGYLPFGALLFRKTYNGGGWSSDYRYTGQELDSEYSLYNYNARLYDPVLGRFITPDNVVQDWYDPQNLNAYAYVRNNPLIYADPTGHYWGETQNGYVQQVGPPDPNNATLENNLNDLWNSTTNNASCNEGSLIAYGAYNDYLYSVDPHLTLTSLQQQYGTILNTGNIDMVKDVKDAQSFSPFNLSKFKDYNTDPKKWDFKNNIPLKVSLSAKDVSKLENFGNVHYGIVCAAKGYSLAFSLWAAGTFQTWKQGGGSYERWNLATWSLLLSDEGAKAMTSNGFSWGDGPNDSKYIVQGWYLYNESHK
jgi:RHS repeat-associated protein